MFTKHFFLTSVQSGLRALFTYVVLFGVFFLTACQPSTDRFVGTWSNTWVGDGANIALNITKDGDGLIVKELIASNGFVMKTHLATVDGSHVSIPTSAMFRTLVLSPDERSFIVVNGSMNFPDLRKIK